LLDILQAVQLFKTLKNEVFGFGVFRFADDCGAARLGKGEIEFKLKIARRKFLKWLKIFKS
jgi:hypothetical protein